MSIFSIEATLCVTTKARLRGLLGVNSHSCPICLVPCASIHTWAMKYPIDVCFCNADMEVIKVERAFAPWKRSACPGAICVIEREASRESWPVVGDSIDLHVLHMT